MKRLRTVPNGVVWFNLLMFLVTGCSSSRATSDTDPDTSDTGLSGVAGSDSIIAVDSGDDSSSVIDSASVANNNVSTDTGATDTNATDADTTDTEYSDTGSNTVPSSDSTSTANTDTDTDSTDDTGIATDGDTGGDTNSSDTDPDTVSECTLNDRACDSDGVTPLLCSDTGIWIRQPSCGGSTPLCDEGNCTACPPGYGGGNCEKINECAIDNGGCDPLSICTDIPGGRVCSACPLGYSGTGETGCVNIDECAIDNGGCDPLSICTDMTGGRICSACPLGYSGTGETGCENINECETDNGGCDPLTICADIPGGRICSACPLGYSGSGETGCVNIDECETDNGGCDPLSTCTDIPGGRICSACPAGYTGSGETGCENINECEVDNGDCDLLTICTDIPGGRICSACPLGYTGTGETGCIGVGECATDNGGCDPLTVCTEISGGRTCSVCPAGYTGSGETGCENINECEVDNGDCDLLTICTDIPGGRICSDCPSGYSGDGETGCADINECATNNGGCDPLTVCTDIPGGRTCSDCPSGFEGDGESGCERLCDLSTLPEPGALTYYNQKLPDPFTFFDGTAVTTQAQWECRRKEILNMAAKYLYGPVPSKPDSTTGTVSGSSISINVTEGLKSETFSAYIGGSGEIIALDLGAGSHMLPSGTKTLGFGSGYEGKIRSLFDISELNTNVALGWMIDRVMDVLEQHPESGHDPSRIVVTGCSGCGKAAFVVGAFSRVPMTIIVESGGGGTASLRQAEWFRHGDGADVYQCSSPPQGIDNLEDNGICGPWVSSAASWLRVDSSKVYNLPFDMHLLLATIAPRYLVVFTNNNSANSWCVLGGTCEALSAWAAKSVWNALGVPENMAFEMYGGGHCGVADTGIAAAMMERAFLGNSSALTDVMIIPATYIQQPISEWEDMWIDWDMETVLP